MSTDEIAQVLYDQNPTLAHDLIEVIDAWDASRKRLAEQTRRAESPHQDDAGWDAAQAERMERVKPFRDALEQRVY